MLLQFLVLAVIAVYFISYYVKPVGKALSFFCSLAGKPFVLVEQKMEQWSTDCTQAKNATSLSRRVLLAHLMYFLLAVSFTLGEAFNTLLALPALFHTAPVTNIPGAFEIASSVLFLAVPAIFGAMFLEMIGTVELSEGLFPRLTLWHRIFLAVYSFLFFLFSIVVIYQFWRFRAIYVDPNLRNSISPLALATMAMYVIGGLGLLVAGGSFLLVRALVVGGEAAILALLWLCSLVFSVVSFVMHLVAKLLEYISRYFSDLSPFDEPGTRSASVEQTMLTGAGSDAFPAPIEKDSLPSTVTLPQEISIMHDLSSFVYAGLTGCKFIVPVARAVTEVRATKVYGSTGIVYRSPSPFHMSRVGVDISPSLMGISGSIRDPEAYKLLFQRLEEKQVNLHKPYDVTPSPFFYLLDSHIGFTAEEHLRNINRRLPSSALAVVTLVSQADFADSNVRKTLEMLMALYREGIVKTTIILDPTSPFGLKYGQEKLIEFASLTLVSLLLAHVHHPDNATCVEVLEWLQSQSAFVSLGFCSLDINSGKTPARGFFLKPFTGKAVLGDADDIRKQALFATDEVGKPGSSSLAFHEAIDINTSVLINLLPLRLDDVRFNETVQLHSQAIHALYPQARLINVRGNGLNYGRSLNKPYRVGVAALYPVHIDLSAAPVLTAQLSQTKEATEHMVPLLPLSGEEQTPVHNTNGNGGKPIGRPKKQK